MREWLGGIWQPATVNPPQQQSRKTQERLAAPARTVCSWLLVDPFGMAALSPGSSRICLTSSSHFLAAQPGQLHRLVQPEPKSLAHTLLMLATAQMQDSTSHPLAWSCWAEGPTKQNFAHLPAALHK